MGCGASLDGDRQRLAARTDRYRGEYLSGCRRVRRCVIMVVVRLMRVVVVVVVVAIVIVIVAVIVSLALRVGVVVLVTVPMLM